MSEHHWNDQRNRSRDLRLRLASIGIELDDPEPEPEPPAPSSPPPIDRAAIRAILEPLECPDWAIESCPSIAHARTYRRS